MDTTLRPQRVRTRPRLRPTSRFVPRFVGALLVALVIAATASLVSPFQQAPGGAVPARLAPAPDFGAVPIAFEPNVGQTADGVRFVAHLGSSTLFLTRKEAVVVPPAGEPVRLHFPGSGRSAAPVGEARLPGVTNYFRGDDPADWHTGIPTYGSVVYAGIYPGIDLVYHGEAGRLEYDFVVHPYADPREIAIAVEGARLSVGESGSLVGRFGGRRLTQRAPLAYQQSGSGRAVVDSRFVVAESGRRASIRLGPYDRSRVLTIDPVVVYSTYLGGADNDSAFSMAVEEGYAYVTGETRSTNFPTQPASLQATKQDNYDAFVAKIATKGTSLVYSTYIGGNGPDTARAIAVSDGAAYVAGDTASADFPTSSATFDGTLTGDRDAFVAKLGPTGGTLAYSTYLGGDGVEDAVGVAVDPTTKEAYVVGATTSTNFPTWGPPYQPTKGAGNYTDAFVTKLTPAGTSLAYSTYLGSNGIDRPTDVAVDASGAAHVAGVTTLGSIPFPSTPSAYQTSNNGGHDVFYTKLHPSGGELLYSSFLGGSGHDYSTAIRLGPAGSVYVAGYTRSFTFPTTPGVYQEVHSGNPDSQDGFVTKFNASPHTTLAYSTFLGSNGGDTVWDLDVDASGAAVVSGQTSSPSFPTFSAFQGPGGSGDGFVAKLNAAGTQLDHSSYLGGDALDTAQSVAVDPTGAIYLAGITASTNFPVVSPLQATKGGVNDAFVMKIADAAPASPTPPVSESPTASPSSSASPTATPTPPAGTTGCVPPPANMRAWWTLDEPAGIHAADIAGLVANNGAHHGGPTPAAGKVAGALAFDGANDFVSSMDQSELLFGTGSLTIDAWISTSKVNGVQPVVDKRGRRHNATTAGYGLFVRQGRIAFHLSNGTSSVDYIPPASAVNTFVANGEWRHVAATVNRGASPSLVLYVDGVPAHVFAPSTVLTGNLDDSGPLSVGRTRPGALPPPMRFFTGKIDEVEMFDRALTAAEVQVLYEAGGGGKCKPHTETTNLVPAGTADEAVAAGDEKCPDQPYFRYAGGNPDNFAGPVDPAYRSTNLALFDSGPHSSYDDTSSNRWFGDSFDLEDKRLVCHVVIRMKMKQNHGLASNDNLYIGHVENGNALPTVFTTAIASAYFPTGPGPGPVTRVWTLNSAGLTALSAITGAANPNDAVLDFYVQDDTTIDHIMLWVWYDP